MINIWGDTLGRFLCRVHHHRLYGCASLYMCVDNSLGIPYLCLSMPQDNHLACWGRFAVIIVSTTLWVYLEILGSRYLFLALYFMAYTMHHHMIISQKWIMYFTLNNEMTGTVSMRKLVSLWSRHKFYSCNHHHNFSSWLSYAVLSISISDMNLLV